MKKRLLIISLILAVLSATLVFAYLQSLEKPKSEEVKVTILVANVPIQARTMIEAKMVKKMEVPDSELVKDYIKDVNLIVGKYAKSAIEKNEGFLAAKLMEKEESTDEITVKIEKNHRAVSINATGESGISKLVKPGDYVDVFMSLTEKKDDKTIIRPDLSRMLLQNMKVLAIDRRLVREANVIEEEKETAVSFLVTLSVPVEEVGKLVLAEDIGSLKLVLRSGEKEKPYTPRTITEQELYTLNGQSGKSAATPKSGTVKKTPTPAATPKSTVKSTPKPSGSPVSGSWTSTKYRSYTVQPGDTLMSISRRYYNNNEDYVLIMKANGIDDKNHLEVGTRLRIPIK